MLSIECAEIRDSYFMETQYLLAQGLVVAYKETGWRRSGIRDLQHF